MSMHIKSPDGVPDVDIHSMRVKPTTTTKTITESGTYNAISDGVDGYSSVTVNVPELPVTFLKSIKSVGNSVILTDIVPAYDWTLIANIKLGAQTLTTGSHMMIGCVSYDGQNIAGYYGPGYDSGNNQMGFYDGNIWGSGNYIISLSSDNKNTPETLIMRRGNGANIFGKQSVINTAPASYTSITAELAILGGNIGGTVYPYASTEMTLYGLQFYNNTGTLIHNLLPAQSKATGRGGLYDIVTNKFYPSSTDYDDVIKEAL